MTEIWKQVVGAGYLYEVSDQGRGRLSPLREIPSPTRAQNEKVQAPPYHYTESGLEGIYLLNGVQKEEYDGEEYVTIKDVDGLHKAIGRHLVMHRKALAPNEIRFLRKAMDMTQAELAEKLRNTGQSVARWEKGEYEIPGAAESLLRVLFLITLMNKEELTALIEKLKTLLVTSGLDELDESNHDAQFQLQLSGSWVEQDKAA